MRLTLQDPGLCPLAQGPRPSRPLSRNAVIPSRAILPSSARRLTDPLTVDTIPSNKFGDNREKARRIVGPEHRYGAQSLTARMSG